MPHSELSKITGYTFKDPALLEEALTHPSCSGITPKKPGYERLEFLGDSVLSLVTSRLLFQYFPKDTEGELTRRRAALTNAKILHEIGNELNIFKHVSIAKDKATIEEREMCKIIGNVLESLIGAMYIDGGISICENFILKTWSDRFQQNIIIDPKSALQEWCQKNKIGCPQYHLLSTKGKDHMPTFEVKVSVPSLPEFEAFGGSKKSAEEAAAQQAINFINKQYD
jgi:ribonuclease-3